MFIRLHLNDFYVPHWHGSLARLVNQSNTPHIWCYFIFVRCVGQSLDSHLSNQFINSTKWQEGSRRGAATAVTAFPSPSLSLSLFDPIRQRGGSLTSSICNRFRRRREEKRGRVSFSVLAAPRGFDSKLRVRLPAVIIMDTSHPMDGRGGTVVRQCCFQWPSILTDRQTDLDEETGGWLLPALVAYGCSPLSMTPPPLPAKKVYWIVEG